MSYTFILSIFSVSYSTLKNIEYLQSLVYPLYIYICNLTNMTWIVYDGWCYTMVSLNNFTPVPTTHKYYMDIGPNFSHKLFFYSTDPIDNTNDICCEIIINVDMLTMLYSVVYLHCGKNLTSDNIKTLMNNFDKSVADDTCLVVKYRMPG